MLFLAVLAALAVRSFFAVLFFEPPARCARYEREERNELQRHVFLALWANKNLLSSRPAIPKKPPFTFAPLPQMDYIPT